MQEKGFWDDIKRAEEVTKESKGIKDKIDNNKVLFYFTAHPVGMYAALFHDL